MFRMSYDAVDFFSADFTAAGVIVAGEEYPLGYFAAEALEVSGQLTLDIGAAAKEFAAEAQMFFAARDPSSARDRQRSVSAAVASAAEAAAV